ncbi:uncharacterized protein [Pithys albifrons albifrons]|uniref:uncharacterized protein n=1 Tax=Pithys albifrons albifrons TaxID=3385563 RepID=UPI003A5CE25B
MAAAPAAPPHPAAPLGGRDPCPSARPQGRRRGDPVAFCLRGGLDSSAVTGKAGRVAGLCARLSQPARGRWPLPGRWAPKDGQWCPAARFLRLSTSFSPSGALALFSPPFFLLALYSRCSMGLKERDEVAPVEPAREDGRAGSCRSRVFSAFARARSLSGALPLLPFGAPRARREALEGRRGYSAFSGFDPRQCLDVGLALRCDAGSSRVIRVINVNVIISPFPCGSVSLHHFQTSPL